MTTPRNRVLVADRPLEFLDATHVRFRGRKLLYFGGSQYLGLGWHPALRRAMRQSLRDGMIHSGASRATTGDQPIYLQAEGALARFFRQPAAALVSSGYLAPLAAVQALTSQVTHLLISDQAHVCVRDAALASGLPWFPIKDGKPEEFRRRCRALGSGGRPLFLTDGTFGTRGGIAPLEQYLSALPSRGWMLVDDAHGAATVGPGGRGALAATGLNDARLVLTISLAKAFGVSGGAVLGDERIVCQLKAHATAFIGSTALPELIPAGLLAALEILRAEPVRIRKLQQNMELFHSLLPSRSEITASPETPVTGLFPSSLQQATALEASLLKEGIHPPWIRYPGGPETGFFRLALSSQHSPRALQTLARAITKGLEVPSRRS